MRLLAPVVFALWAAPAAAAPDAASPRRAEIDEAIAGGRPARARLLASVWLREDPQDADRWVAVALATDDPREAEPLLDEALRASPDHREALVALGRVRTAQGRGSEAEPPLRRAIEADPTDALAREALVALADALADAEPARRALAEHPGAPDAALAVARWTRDPAEAREALASVAVPDRRVLSARIEAAARRGELEPAQIDLEALSALAPHGPETEHLARWLRCLRAGTVTPADLDALWDLRRRALLSPTGREALTAERTALVERAGRCPAALALSAVLDDAPERADARIAALGAAVALDEGDAGLAAALGRALLAADRSSEAVPWLRTAAGARPFEPPTDLARALAAAGDREGAARLLDEAAPAFPDDVSMATLRADLAPDRPRALEILVAAVERTADPALLARARTLADALDRTDALETVLRGPRPLPPVGDEASEEIVVVAKDSRARLRELAARMRELGYGEPVVRANGEVHFETQGLAQPSVTLRPDGLYDVQRAGRVPVKSVPWDPDSPRVWKVVSERKLVKYRAALMETLQPELVAWRAAICAEGLEDRLLHEIPGTLDAVWRDGVARDGRSLTTPDERRAALLDWWVTRTCTPEGDAVRALIARYLAAEVQPSPWPVTPAEIADINARRPCEVALAL